jgi:hypothetical protein
MQQRRNSALGFSGMIDILPSIGSASSWPIGDPG